MDSFNVRIGGEAGWGIATTANIISKIAIKLGYYIFSSKDYMSQIKGGHNFHTLKISTEPVHADTEKINVLIAFDNKTYFQHSAKVVKGGLILFNNNFSPKKEENVNHIAVNVNNNKLINGYFLGAISKCLGVDFNVVEETLNKYFSKKSQLKDKLLNVTKESYELTDLSRTDLSSLVNVGGVINSVKLTSELTLNKQIPNKQINGSESESLYFLNGNEAITKGALKSKLVFHVQYPMTPVSGILHCLAKEAIVNKELKVIQPEDEIAVINMALGASYTGARSMVATSGGGFALMIESVGLAAMAEIPLVIIMGQRPGPATGLPTKTEQGDLSFVLNAGTGDFPQIVISPGDIEECYTETQRAFYLAEKYQLPVIVLVDKHLTESYKTIKLKNFDFSQKINVLDYVNSNQLNQDGLFKRYASEKRTLPGTENGIYTCAGDEHNEVGEITEDVEIRKKMMKRRMDKLNLVHNELPVLEVYGPKNADLTIISWGSNKGAIIEAVNQFNNFNCNDDSKNKKVNFLQIKYMMPFLSEQARKIMKEANHLVLVENNYSAQLGKLISAQTNIEIKDKILRYDGQPFTINQIFNELKKLLKSY